MIISIRKYITVFFLLVLVQIPTVPKAQAQYCDVCTAGAVLLATQEITVVLGYIVTELNEIGKAVQQVIETNATGFASLNQVIIEVSRIEVNEAHILAEKQATLEIKRSINDKFGSVSEDLCYEVEVTSGKVAGNTAIENAVRNNVNNFAAEYRARTRGAGRRTALLKEIPETIRVGDYFNGETIATPEMMQYLPQVVVALSETKSFEAPRVPTPSAPLSNTEDDYAQKYRGRLFSLQIVQDAIRASIQDQSIPTKETGEWVATKLENAGVNSGSHVDGAMTTKAGLIKAVGHAKFGSTGSAEVANLSGDELMRVHIEMLGHSNYLLAENWKVANHQKILMALELSKAVEAHHNEDLTKALINSDR